MKIINKCFAATFFFISLSLFSLDVFGCGTERWQVKVAQDQHVKYFFKNNDIAGGVLTDPIYTSVAVLHTKAYPFPTLTGKPPAWSYYQRAGDTTEFTIWKVRAVLKKIKPEDDEDYHLVLKSGKKYMVAEIPSENCVAETVEPLKSLIIQARQDLDDWKSTQTTSTFNQKVMITGLGFFDRIHGATGASPNGIELHPVIKIEFID